MVKIFAPLERDILSLNDLQRQDRPTQSSQPKNYQNTVVLKPWGYEFLIFENEHVAAWFLHIKGGHSTSMHCHPQKKTSLIILKGQALSYTFGSRSQLSSMEAVIIEKGVFHSTSALTTDGIDLIEVESPPKKTDLVRLQDKYGRQSTGYEGLSEMVTINLERYRYFHFKEGTSNIQIHKQQEYQVELQNHDSLSLKKEICIEKYSLYCSCRGEITKNISTPKIIAGDVVEAVDLKNKEFEISKPSTFLKISPSISS